MLENIVRRLVWICLAFLCLLYAPTHALENASDAIQAPSMRYIILDATHDSPSITALLMALELTSRPNAHVVFLGTIATNAPELDQLQHLLHLAGLDACLPPILSVDETELYPVYGDVLEKLPETVQFLLDAVQKHPGQVTIYSSGSLAAVTMAEQVHPSFASNVGEVMIVGNTYGSKPFARSELAQPAENSPFLRDQEAFMQILQGDIPLLRMVGTSEPVLSGKEIADRVLERVKRETGEKNEDRVMKDRPLSQLYLKSHLDRLKQGHEKAILMQEPGMAALLDPSIIKAESDVTYEFQPTLGMRKIEGKDITPGDRSTLIHEIDERRFWDLLVHVRSKDWSGFCAGKRGGAPGKVDQVRDEL